VEINVLAYEMAYGVTFQVPSGMSIAVYRRMNMCWSLLVDVQDGTYESVFFQLIHSFYVLGDNQRMLST
jgi:hypothetical protein